MPLSPSATLVNGLHSRQRLSSVERSTNYQNEVNHLLPPRKKTTSTRPPIRPILPIKKSITTQLTSDGGMARPPPSRPSQYSSQNGYGSAQRNVMPRTSSINGQNGKYIVKARSASNSLNESSSRASTPVNDNILKHRNSGHVLLKLPLSRNNTLEDLSKYANDNQRSYSRESSYVSRSPSPMSSCRSSSVQSNYDSLLSSRSCSIGKSRTSSAAPPRRVFPQTYNEDNALNLAELQSLEQSSVVFDANMSFVLGCSKQKIKQSLRASPAHMDRATASNYLSDKISHFLQRTDHVMDEWKSMGRKNFDDDTMSYIEKQRDRNRHYNNIGRSRSVTNIMIKGFQLLKSQPPTSRSSSVNRDYTEDDCYTILDDDEEVIILN